MAAGNLGKTKNSGYELELKYADRIGKDFSYSVGITYSHARNEILDMDEPASKTDYRKEKDILLINISDWFQKVL